ncbi:KICSTOR complex protein ITFG2 isoform X3 [Ixodes scapularis]
MRAVSFLDKVEYEFVGNFLQDAICLGDADNDKGIELVAANLHGDLAVFKYRQSRPWATASDLGAVRRVRTGGANLDASDARSHLLTTDSSALQNKIVSISCDGWCNIFALQSDATEEERKHMAPLHSQRLPANTKMALLADINGDGKVELILGLTDRVVRTYQWTCFLENGSEGKLVGLQKWEFANQVGTISLSANQAGGLALLVAQPGGTYTKLDFGSSTPDRRSSITAQSTLPADLTGAGSGEAAQVCPQHHKLDSSHMRNPNVSSAILGGVRGTRDGRLTDSLMALATLDGRYHYQCVIYGWDGKCAANRDWIYQMGVHNLSHEDRQPFYNVLVEDGSNRYAAQENLRPSMGPKAIPHPDVGKYFERFCGTHYQPNAEKEDEYPEDAEARQELLNKTFHAEVEETLQEAAEEASSG